VSPGCASTKELFKAEYLDAGTLSFSLSSPGEITQQDTAPTSSSIIFIDSSIPVDMILVVWGVVVSRFN